MKELKETVELMLSDNYVDRFMAEYYQLKIRHDKLETMIFNWDNLFFIPTCPKSIYVSQLEAMKQLLVVLEDRAKIESIPLN